MNTFNVVDRLVGTGSLIVSKLHVAKHAAIAAGHHAITTLGLPAAVFIAAAAGASTLGCSPAQQGVVEEGCALGQSDDYITTCDKPDAKPRYSRETHALECIDDAGVISRASTLMAEDTNGWQPLSCNGSVFFEGQEVGDTRDVNCVFELVNGRTQATCSALPSSQGDVYARCGGITCGGR